MPDGESTYWDESYLKGRTGWDMGQVSTPLQAYFDQLPDKNASIELRRSVVPCSSSQSFGLNTVEPVRAAGAVGSDAFASLGNPRLRQQLTIRKTSNFPPHTAGSCWLKQ